IFRFGLPRDYTPLLRSRKGMIYHPIIISVRDDNKVMFVVGLGAATCANRQDAKARCLRGSSLRLCASAVRMRSATPKFI
ncbi:MAG: hypothetical protein AB7E82_12510, partial [Cyclobacteriaceae bacterium]